MAPALSAQADQFITKTTKVDSANHTYHIHKPDTVEKPLPLVVVLHGGGGNGRGLRETYGFKPLIEAGRFIAVYPDAGRGGWLPSHLVFLDQVIEEVIAAERIERANLFVTGASRGGLMTFIMAAESKHRFRAAGTVISSQMRGLADEHPITRSLDFAMIAGTADPLMPYNGGWGAMRNPRKTGDPGAELLPVEDVISSLLTVNGITTDPIVRSLPDKDPEDGCETEVRLWYDEVTGRRVQLVKVDGGGHVVPGGRQYLDASLIGPVCNDFDHAEMMWQFFSASIVTEGTSRAQHLLSPDTQETK